MGFNESAFRQTMLKLGVFYAGYKTAGAFQHSSTHQRTFKHQHARDSDEIYLAWVIIGLTQTSTYIQSRSI